MSSFDSTLVAPIAPFVKSRNAFFDGLFYDVSKLGHDEQDALSPAHDREGAVLVVPPAGSGRPILHYDDATSFLADWRDTVQAVVVAGVGSSALGTAALARNVADAFGFDVAGIVSGYGCADLLSEACGGWFFYGTGDRLRHQARELLNRLGPCAEPAAASGERSAALAATVEPGSDLQALSAVLEAEPPRLRLLVGHSKGDLLLDFALERFAAAHADRPHRYFDTLDIVTFGAVTDLPPAFRRVHQFIGQVDWFGGLNSRMDVGHVTVPGAWHHLNTRYPMHIDAEQVLREHIRLVG